MRATALLVLTVLAGCGYSSGLVVPGDGRCIEVRMFENRTFRRDLERDQTRLVLEAVRARTGLRIAAPGETADLVITGAIVAAEEQVLSERGKGELRESSVVLDVEFRVTGSDGEPVVEPTRFTQRAAFAPVKSESVRTAELAAMREIAERIVYSLARDW